MNLLYLSPHFPAHYSMFVERLALRGVKVFGITDQPDECLAIPFRCLEKHLHVVELPDFGPHDPFEHKPARAMRCFFQFEGNDSGKGIMKLACLQILAHHQNHDGCQY